MAWKWQHSMNIRLGTPGYIVLEAVEVVLYLSPSWQVEQLAPVDGRDVSVVLDSVGASAKIELEEVVAVTDWAFPNEWLPFRLWERMHLG